MLPQLNFVAINSANPANPMFKYKLMKPDVLNSIPYTGIGVCSLFNKIQIFWLTP